MYVKIIHPSTVCDIQMQASCTKKAGHFEFSLFNIFKMKFGVIFQL